MVKVPGTEEGAIAVRRLIAEGINVNITLLFAIEAHERVIEAYMAGLEDRLKKNQPIDGISSVASFFVSRVDTEIDKRLDALISKAQGAEQERLKLLKGRAAIAKRSSLDHVGRHWQSRARASSDLFGPAPAPRIRTTVT